MAYLTVAIPTHNRPRFLRRAVESVLQQTFTDFDLLILDNGSDDAGWVDDPLFRDPRIRCICHPRNIGVVANWNTAVSEATGEALSLFHDDDVMLPRFLEKCVSALNEWPAAGMVHTLARRVDCAGRNLGIYGHPNHHGVLSGHDYMLWNLRAGGYAAIPSSVVIRLSTHRQVGPYGVGEWMGAFDLNYYLRVAREFDIGIIDEPLVEYTLHPCQIMEAHWRQRVEDARVEGFLEMLSAAAWILEREDGNGVVRREMTALMTSYIQKLTAIQLRSRAGQRF
jgi:glycosyltransferase involved in cell wall biosynthesis